MSPSKLVESRWSQLSQPLYLHQEMALDESDPEVKREVTSCATKLHVSQELGCSRFKCFSTWSSVKRAITSLISLLKDFKGRNGERSKKPTNPLPIPSAAELEHAGQIVVRAVQEEAFAVELEALSSTGGKKSP